MSSKLKKGGLRIVLAVDDRAGESSVLPCELSLCMNESLSAEGERDSTGNEYNREEGKGLCPRTRK